MARSPANEQNINCSSSNSINKLVAARPRRQRDYRNANGVGSPVTVKTAADCSFVELHDDRTVIGREREKEKEKRRKRDKRKRANELSQIVD